MEECFSADYASPYSLRSHLFSVGEKGNDAEDAGRGCFPNEQ